jgi:hypothetical protein
MFLESVVDVLALNLLGLLSGLLGLLGVVFCQQPTLIYVSGCVLEGFFSAGLVIKYLYDWYII